MKSVRVFLRFGACVDIDYVVKAGSAPGPIQTDLSYPDGGTPPDATGATVTFRYRAWEDDTTAATAAGTVVDSNTVRGTFPSNTADPGLYQAEFFVQFLDGTSDTFPSDETHPYLLIWVQPAIGG